MNIFETFAREVSQDAKNFPLGDDASIDLLPMGSDLAKRKFEQLMEPYQARLKAGVELTEEESKKLNQRFFSEVIVKGWHGIKDADGKEIKFSAEACGKLLEALPRFFNLVVRLASDESAFEVKKTEEDVGN